MKISSWGKYPVIDAKVYHPRMSEDIKQALGRKGDMIPRGMGRSYGDSALGGKILSMLRLKRILAFDSKKGIVTAEAGVSLDELIKVFIPRGYFLSVTPGTRFVTIGGAIASDVHGKNHHKEGAFSEHVESMEVMLPGGKVIKCSEKVNSELFHATCGGMGLVGIILSATIRLKKIESAFIRQLAVPAKNIDQIMDFFEKYKDYTYSMAWIDGLSKGKKLGRSVLFLGEHAKLRDLSGKARNDPLMNNPGKLINLPVELPAFALNRWSLKSFNALYYLSSKLKSKSSVVDIYNFFYPLDALENWNRLYGKNGFTQYQFVIPLEYSRAGIKEVLEKVSARGTGSFLGVLKLFGKQNKNFLTFPLEGYTLALDFPISEDLFPFLDELDKIVLKYNGRIYLTKDVRMAKGVFQKAYPSHLRFKKIRKKFEGLNKFRSLQSTRIGV